MCKIQPSNYWIKSGKNIDFSVIVAKAGRGEAELLVDSIPQGFKKYNNCKKSGGFKNDDSSSKTDDFRIRRFKKYRYFMNDDGSDKTDDFNKNDCSGRNDDCRSTDGFRVNYDVKKIGDPEKNGEPEKNGKLEKNCDPKKNDAPEKNGELEENGESEMICDPKMSWDLEMRNQGLISNPCLVLDTLELMRSLGLE